MKEIFKIYSLFSIIYAFIFWGFWWGILNIFFPFSPIYDLVLKIGKIN